MIMPYDRDEYGNEAVYDGALGRYRWLSAEERAARHEMELKEAARQEARVAEHSRKMADPVYRENYLASITPHPQNTNRVSYGRGEIRRHADGTEYTVNWPARG